jgi:hypothetical protein
VREHAAGLAPDTAYLLGVGPRAAEMSAVELSATVRRLLERAHP